jgi:hypothetical protein
LAWHRTFFLMEHASGHTAKWCSITSLGTPERSEGSHVNTSEFSRRKATSTLSYLGVRAAPIVKVRDVPSPRGTFLVNSASPMILPLRGAGPTPSHTMAIGSGEYRFLAALGPELASSSIASPRLPGSPATSHFCDTANYIPDVRSDGQDTPGGRYLDHIVGVVSGHHELGQGRPAGRGGRCMAT